jgi:starch phosphorylase
MRVPDIKTRPTAQIEIPVQFSRLRDIAYNMSWSWSQPTRELFHRLDPERWHHYRNPIELLIDLEPERWHALQRDESFIRNYRSVIEEFDLHMAPDEPTWFDKHYPNYDGGPIAYFSTEYGWHECLQIYSGGLGVLSGDHSKAASDLDLPFVGVGLMYQHGYFRQTIDADGRQQHFYPDYDFHRLPLLPVVNDQGGELRVAVEFPGREVQVRVWKAAVGRSQVLLLDTDLDANDPADRPITSVLYVRGREMRLCQEYLLGVGGVDVLRALGITPAVWHMNEGHSSLLSAQRLRRLREQDELPFDEACRKIAGNAILTTHTPVPAGNETFDVPLIRHYLEGWAGREGIPVDELIGLGRAHPEAHDEPFNMTALAIRTSRQTNGVSALHGRVAGEMWDHLQGEHFNIGGVQHITNGAHVPTWLGRDMRALLKKYVDERFEAHLLDIDFPRAMESIPDAELWEAHCSQKRRFVRNLRRRVLLQRARHGNSPDELRALEHLFDPEVLLIGFARRFATYKRADLLLHDFDRLRDLVATDDRPVQFVFAGKAHPADRPGQDLIARIWEASKNPELKGRVLFLEDYDMRMARNMTQGVDVWLNNPRRPMEASGTSGMKVAFNGGLNCSVLDGWWCEGFDPAHGWAIGEADSEQDDQADADALHRVLKDEVVSCFYSRDEQGLPRQWVQRMKLAMGQLIPRFSSSRMVREYTERLYFPRADR